MKATDTLKRAIGLRILVEQRFNSCLSAMDHCTNADESFLDEVIGIEMDLRNLIRKENYLADQVKRGVIYTGIDLGKFEEKYT